MIAAHAVSADGDERACGRRARGRVSHGAVLQLNPHVPVVSITALRWFVALLALYGPYLTVAILLLILGARSDRVAPAASRLAERAHSGVAQRGVGGGGGGAHVGQPLGPAIHADRSRRGSHAPGRGGDERSARSCWWPWRCCGISFGRRGNRPAAVLMVASVTASILVPLWVRGPGELPVPAARRPNQARPVAQAPRVRLLLLDGASRGFVLERVAAGQLPNFGRLIERGAVLDLATLRPTQAESGLDGGGDGEVPAEERRAIRVRVSRERRRGGSGQPAARLLLRAGAAVSGIRPRGAASWHVNPRAADLGHPRRLWRCRPAS